MPYKSRLNDRPRRPNAPKMVEKPLPGPLPAADFPSLADDDHAGKGCPRSCPTRLKGPTQPNAHRPRDSGRLQSDAGRTVPGVLRLYIAASSVRERSPQRGLVVRFRLPKITRYPKNPDAWLDAARDYADIARSVMA